MSAVQQYGPQAPTLHALRGIRFAEGTGGAAPAAPAPAAAVAGQQAGGTPAPTPAPTPTPPSPAGAAPAAPPAADSVESLPEFAQKMIRDLRTEAAGYRTGKNSVEQELATFRDAAAVTLGLKPAQTQDPAALAAALKAAEETARTNAVKLGIYQGAAAHAANPDALLDSHAFLEATKTLDPTAGDFPAQLSTAIKNAVDANPHLKTVRATGASSVSAPSGGTGENGPITAEQLDALSKTNPERVVELHKSGALDHLL